MLRRYPRPRPRAARRPPCCWRRHQLQAICDHVGRCAGAAPAVLMGDMNEWSAARGAFRGLEEGWRLLAPGRSFPARRPVAQLDRIVVSGEWQVEDPGVHHSALSAVGSDHLPVWARLVL